MKHMLDRLSGKADDSEHDNAHAEAKMQVLHELRNMAMDMMGDKVRDKMPHEGAPHEMHEVDVAAPSAAGLHKGLDMAKSIIPKSLNADRDSSFGEKLNSKLPHLGSNGSELDAAAEDDEEQTEHGRSEPNGDEGEPDQQMLNPHRNEETDDDMYGDMDHDELDQHIEHLRKLKQAKMMKR